MLKNPPKILNKSTKFSFKPPEIKIFVEELSSDTAVLRRLPTKKWAKSSFFLINVAKSVGNPERWAHPMRVEHGWPGPANEKRVCDLPLVHTSSRGGVSGGVDLTLQGQS